MLLSDWLARYQALVPTYFLLRVALLMGLGLLALMCVMIGVHGRQDSPAMFFPLNSLSICSLLVITTMMLAHAYLLLVYPMREMAAYPRRVEHPLLLCLMTVALTSYAVFVRSLASRWSGDGRLDVKSAIEALVQPISRLRIALQFNGFDGRCAPAIAEAIFRACQEGITNCLRHSDASLLTITLEKNHHGFQAELQDNGKTKGRNPAGNGLNGIESRVRQLGGRMEYGAEANGFRLAFTLPDTSHVH